MRLVVGIFCTRSAEGCFWNQVEARFFDDAAAVAAKTILTFFNAPEGEVDAFDIVPRMGEWLLTAFFEDVGLCLFARLQVVFTTDKVAWIAHFVLQKECTTTIIVA